MSIRPFRDIKRRKTKEINVGSIKVGGNKESNKSIKPTSTPKPLPKKFNKLMPTATVTPTVIGDKDGASVTFFGDQKKIKSALEEFLFGDADGTGFGSMNFGSTTETPPLLLGR